ncbi:hypothetical protein ACIBLB_40365 [Streptosporangium canum]|uniref:hypothetical protein n=1 Tax=Streptosporangium canum TaxID=324952 RepID=UPI0037892672
MKHAGRSAPARVVIKDAAFDVLTGMLRLIGEHTDTSQEPRMVHRLEGMPDERFQHLRDRMDAVVPQVAAALPPRAAERLSYEHTRWAATTSWELTNAADPCGT